MNFSKMSFHSRSLSELSRSHKRPNDEASMLDLSFKKLQKFDEFLYFNSPDSLPKQIFLLPDVFGFGAIQILNLRGNLLTSTNGILDYRKNYLPNLRVLDLSENRLGEIGLLPCSLRELNLSNNQIESLQSPGLLKRESQLRLLGSLEKLDVSFNRIKVIMRTDLENNKKLLEVNCSHNEIKSLKGFTILHELFRLDVSYNKIEDLAEFKVFKDKAPSLRQLLIKNNPVAIKYPPVFKKELNQRKSNAVNVTIQKYLPLLNVLDGMGLEQPVILTKNIQSEKENLKPQPKNRPSLNQKPSRNEHRNFNSGSMTERGSLHSEPLSPVFKERAPKLHRSLLEETIFSKSKEKASPFCQNLITNMSIQEEARSSLDSDGQTSILREIPRRGSASSVPKLRSLTPGSLKAAAIFNAPPSTPMKLKLENTSSSKKCFTDTRIVHPDSARHYPNTGVCFSQSLIKIVQY